MQPKASRSFARGLAVLEALNRLGSATALRLAQESKVPRATVYRLLQTLLDLGYIRRSPGDDRYQLRLKVRGLSEGFEDEHWISAVAAPVLLELTKSISWPCDVSTLEGVRMIIRDTTHRVAPLSIDRNMVGREMPLLGSSAGLAYIAFTSAAERATLLGLLARSDDPADAPARDAAYAERVIAATQRLGYGLRQGGPIWPHSGAVALPIMEGDRVLGCISAIWMARVIGNDEGVERCLAPLRAAKATIEARLAAGADQDAGLSTSRAD
ncbi:helix-turn-helix domain-containing protein [Methylobacterium sp. JK268]